MKILSLESSCDETAAAVVQDGQHVLSNVIASSAEMHTKSEGIIPEVAARQQIKSIIPVIDKALNKASLALSEVDSIAVTYGPGLIGSLLVGVETAKTLSLISQIPLIRVNHLIGHIYATWLNSKIPQFPAIALIVSGGHTDLIYLKDHNKLQRLGGTRDDAAGEAFDKTARLLNLGYPGGPAISAAADQYFQSSNINHLPADKAGQPLTLFPRPMIDSENYDFSFSGLKTAVYNYTKSSHKEKGFLAANIQEAIIDTLISKSVKAVSEFKVNNFILCGGVAANKRLRYKFSKVLPQEIKLHIPEIKYCTDNAAMIGTAAFYNQNFIDPTQLDANPQLSITDY